MSSWADLQGGTWLHYEATALHAVADAPAGDPPVHDLVLAGAKLHGVVGRSATIGYHVGFEFALGGAIDRGGFAYDVTLFPVGVAVRLGETGVLALGAGVEASGATGGAMDDAVLLPLEATLELGGGRLRLLARGRASYVAGAEAREHGAPSIPFADELDAMVGLRVGHHYDQYGYPAGNGYFLGAAYRELAGTRFAGLVLGYSIDFATRRKRA